jgi:hypothetical protein
MLEMPRGALVRHVLGPLPASVMTPEDPALFQVKLSPLPLLHLADGLSHGARDPSQQLLPHEASVERQFRHRLGTAPAVPGVAVSSAW